MAEPTYFKGGLKADELYLDDVVVSQGVAVADITPAADGTTAGTALNALLASLRAAGLIAS